MRAGKVKGKQGIILEWPNNKRLINYFKHYVLTICTDRN
jgi:hypothetical protein